MDDPSVRTIRETVRIAEAIGTNVTIEAVRRAMLLVFDHFEAPDEWPTLVAISREFGAVAAACYLFGAQFPPEEMHFVLATALFVAGGGQCEDGGATQFPA